MAKPRITRNSKGNGAPAPTMSEISTATVPKTASPGTPNSFIATQIDLEAQIRMRAYQLYEERGCTPGQENDDWFRAEQEIRAHLGRHNA
jgi:hypothetical protein